MPTDGHWDYCRCAACWTPARLAAEAERRALVTMTFAERKAYRIARAGS